MKRMTATKPLASVSRALTIVEYLARNDPDGVPLTQISKDLSLNKATVYNTLATLREHTWVEQDAVTGYYRLGDGILPIATYRTATQRIVDDLHPSLIAISRRFNELVHLGRLSGTHIVYLDKVEPDRPIRVVSRIGREAVAARTSLGRALIAALPPQQRDIDWYLSDAGIKQLDARTQEHLKESFKDNIRLFETRGWTQEIEENEAGIACVAVPVRLPGGSHLAISISTPVERMPEDVRPQFARGIAEELAKLPQSAGIKIPQAALLP
jgi:DNA-binding IclR family transcriptional regulator